jgi:hypothetical protein
VLAAVLSGVAGVAIAAGPAHAGDTSRYNGCAAHWRTTAAWNECENSPGANLRLQVDCNYQLDYVGDWRFAKGTVNPVDRVECESRANSAWNGYK